MLSFGLQKWGQNCVIGILEASWSAQRSANMDLDDIWFRFCCILVPFWQVWDATLATFITFQPFGHHGHECSSRPALQSSMKTVNRLKLDTMKASQKFKQ